MLVDANNEEKDLKVKNKKFFDTPFVKVPVGYVVVTEGLVFSKTRVLEPGLRFVLPTTSRTHIPSFDIPVDYKKESFKSKDGYEIIVDTAVTYRIEDPEKYYHQKDVLKQLNITVSGIIRRIIAEQDYRSISIMKIDLMNLKPEFVEIKEDCNNFFNKYGILIEDIAIQDVELNEELRKSFEADEITKAKNRRELEIAEAQQKIAEIEAENIRKKGDAEAEVQANRLTKIIDALKDASPEQLNALKYLNDNGKLTVIENGNSDMLAQFLALKESQSEEKSSKKR